MKKKILQVPVIVGKGSEQFFVEKDVTISPPSPPIFKIVEIEKKVIVTDVAVIPGKVIFNAFIWKNVIYKTVEDVHDGIVNGPIFHATFKIPFGGFVEIDSVGKDKCKEGDVAELLEAYVEGQKDYLHGETECKGIPVFTKLLEKDVVKLTFKVVRTEHIPVLCDDYDEKDKCDNDKYDNDKFDNDKFDNDKFDNDKFDKDEKGKGKWDEKYDDKVEKKHGDKDEYDGYEKGYDKDGKWDKRYDCRGDFYANYRGGKPYKK